ncbi:SMI1/KNR4 family protein [Streptomyces sp. NPDC060333]|uniref:SMI1/KNR4 family protein n=1 Tax=Streptomyces sp. NPDC060333 TaxID=3347098 RepID=UPI00364A79FD
MSAARLERILGPERRVLPIREAQWREVEEWSEAPLPEDLRSLFAGYGDGVILGHLFVPHPNGGVPLLTFMQDERETLCIEQESLGSLRAGIDPTRVIPWGHHDWNGDRCLLIPDDASGWVVAVSYRQCPEVEVVASSISEFLHQLLVEEKRPRGWPGGLPVWEEVEGSTVV